MCVPCFRKKNNGMSIEQLVWESIKMEQNEDLITGKKDDSGKGRYSMVLGDFKNALREVVKVGTNGAKKYEDSNWLKVDKGIERYSDAEYRHLLEGDGINTEDFGLLHAAHAAWNALAVLELMLREKK